MESTKYGENLIRQISSECIESFSPEFIEVCNGDKIPADIFEYLQMREFRISKARNKDLNLSSLLQLINTINDKMEKGQYNENVAESEILACLELINNSSDNIDLEEMQM